MKSVAGAVRIGAAAPGGTALSASALHLQLAAWRHGVWMPVVVMLLGAAAVLLRQGSMLRDEASSPPASHVPLAAATVRPDATDVERLRALRMLLGAANESVAQVRRLVVLSQPELAWHRAEFSQAREPALGAVRLQMAVPTRGEYAVVRHKLETLLAEMPNLSLDEVQFRRTPAAEAGRLDVRVRMSLWLDQRGPGGGS